MSLSIVLFYSAGGNVLIDLTSRASSLSFGTNEHGYASLDAFYPCSLLESFSIYDRAGLPHVTVTDNGDTVWEGRLEDVAIVDGGVSLTAFGYQRALSDTLYTATHTAASSSTIAAALVADVAATNTTQLSTSTALITTNALSVTETYNDMRPAEILSRLAGYGDTSGNLWEWGVYNQRILYFRQRGSAGRAWYVDATAIKLERSLDKLYNSAYATYTAGTNSISRTASSTSSDSVSRYGITREAAVNSDKKDATIAAYQRDTFLADNKDATPRAKIAFASVYDASGGKWPLYMVRAGDTITIRNLPPTISTTVDKIRTFYVARTNYSADDDVLTVEPSAYTPTIDNQISAGTGSAQGGADPLTYIDTTSAVTFASVNVGSATGATTGQVRASAFVSGYLPFVTADGNYGVTSSPQTCLIASVDVASTITRWVQTYFVATTNDGSNYWTIAIIKISDSSSLASFNTSSATASTWTRLDSGTLAIAMETSWIGLYITATKTGAPGALFLAGPTMYCK